MSRSSGIERMETASTLVIVIPELLVVTATARERVE
jgi:hypothetical protein